MQLFFVQWWWLGEQEKGKFHAHGILKTDSWEAKAGINTLVGGWQGGLVTSTVACLVVNSSTAFQCTPGLASLFVGSLSARCHWCSLAWDLGTGRGSFKVHLFNTLKKWAFSWSLTWEGSSSADTHGCNEPKPIRVLTHCLYSVSEACTACSQVSKGFKICLCWFKLVSL